MPKINHQHLLSLCKTLLATGGMPIDDADLVATLLVKAELRGYAGHGVNRVPQYLEFITKGIYNLSEKPAIERLSRTIEQMHRDSHNVESTKDLAEKVGLSVSQLNRTFRRQIGTSPHQYLVKIRLESASRALAETNRTISSIAQEFGFHDHAHFTRTFHKHYGVTPTAYRREHKHPSLRSESQ